MDHSARKENRALKSTFGGRSRTYCNSELTFPQFSFFKTLDTGYDKAIYSFEE